MVRGTLRADACEHATYLKGRETTSPGTATIHGRLTLPPFRAYWLLIGAQFYSA